LALGLTVPAVGCAIDDKVTPDKGLVDTSAPPAGDPGHADIGKADSLENLVQISVESPHPYTNDLDLDLPVDLHGVLPWCANRARLHASILRVENNYDYVTISSTGDSHTQRLTGAHDDEWTEWFELDEGAKAMNVNLATDYSITEHGVEFDLAQYEAAVICPAVVYPPCPSGTVDITAPRGTCECQRAPVCVNTNDVEVRHNTYRGFNNSGKVVRGLRAYTSKPGPADGLVDTLIGSVHRDALWRLMREAGGSGLLYSDGYSGNGEWTEYFSIKAGDQEVTFTAALGEHTPEVVALIEQFEALFSCTDADEPLACAEDYSCQADGECAEACFCPQVYDPVCGVNGRTYSNACAAGCANIGVRHPGECGQDGDMCAGILGLPCATGFQCYGVASYPDASGICRALDYCEDVSDCDALPHDDDGKVWDCSALNQCIRETPAWATVAGWSFSVAANYPNNASSWKQLYLPAGATEMRLVVSRFALEANYDFFEVWGWDGSAWTRVARFTGTAGPQPGQAFPGRYHYLHFVSDSSVSAQGFAVTAEYQ
jgi:hypothetical protein